MREGLIERINELAREAKLRKLTDGEAEERARLRSEYIAAFRESARSQLDSITVLYPDGSKRKLREAKPD